MIISSPHQGLIVIALFKLAKGFVLLFVGAGLLRLVDPEIVTFLTPIVDLLHLHGHSRILHSLLLKITAGSIHQVVLIAYASLLYAVLLMIEGFGLWLEASWAAYMTIISSSIFLPVEFYEVIRHLSVLHVAVLLINIGIVVYLVMQLGRRLLQ
ncbi:MAG TPA: DUF2127 domain-containing protein [Nitrospira sp.]|nr:DUF2127 domain-containing protein [Nitrospira sp.]